MNSRESEDGAIRRYVGATLWVRYRFIIDRLESDLLIEPQLNIEFLGAGYQSSSSHQVSLQIQNGLVTPPSA